MIKKSGNSFLLKFTDFISASRILGISLQDGEKKAWEKSQQSENPSVTNL